MANGRVETRCDNCGQEDDHPKLHYPPQTFHHDCIPAFVMDDLTSFTTWVPDERGGYRMSARVPIPEDEQPDHLKRVLDIRKKALSGVRGPKLLAHIQNEMNHGDGQEA